MKILNLSIDKAILEADSIVAKRMVDFGNIVDQYICVVPSIERKIVKLSDKVVAYGSGGETKIFQLINIYKISNKIIKENGVDIITVQEPFEIASIGSRLARRHRIGLNIQEHGDVFSHKYWRNESLKNFYRYYLGLFNLRKADSLRVVSQKTRDFFVNKLGIASDKIVAVPVFTDPGSIPEKISSLGLREEFPGKFIFLTMGRFVKQKNLLFLVRAFEKVSVDNENAVLCIIGRGPEKASLEKAIRELGLENKVIIRDWVDDVYPVYASADAYVLSSNYEGWGRVIVEAVMMNLPVIMTEVGCAGELIKDNQSGILVPVGDEEKLLEAMSRIMNDKNLRENLARRAKQDIEKLPNKQETLNLYLESWKKALKH